MKTDNNYIYPETPEELAMFYGWECERHNGGGSPWFEDYLCFESLEIVKEEHISYRIPLPTIHDLKVGDVVQGDKMLELTELDEFEIQWLKDNPKPISLLIGRNTWVPIKCN